MNIEFLRFSKHCNEGFQSPWISYFFMWCLVSHVSKEHCTFIFVRGSTSSYVRHSITFQRPVRLFVNNEFRFCDIEEVHLCISDLVWCLGCQFCYSRLLRELQNSWTRVACHTIMTSFELLLSPFRLTLPILQFAAGTSLQKKGVMGMCIWMIWEGRCAHVHYAVSYPC